MPRTEVELIVGLRLRMRRGPEMPVSARRQERLLALEIGDVPASVGKRGDRGRVVSQPFLDDLRLLGRPDPPAVAEDEVAADPGADEDRELRAGEELQPPPACRDGRRQRERAPWC